MTGATNTRCGYTHRPIDGVSTTTLLYAHNPIDVEGWRGDNFAFTFNVADYNVVTSDSVHLPPTVHLFMQATGVYVCNFLPKPAETVPGTERTPWYHRNVDFDEIAFFHGGSLYGIPMPPGLISHARRACTTAPRRRPANARAQVRQYDTVDWRVIAIDTRQRLVFRRPRCWRTIWRSTDGDTGQARLSASPYLVAYQNDSKVRDVYGGVAELVVLRATCSSRTPVRHRAGLHAPDRRRRHPPMINALARAGHHVIYCNSRFRGTDSALLMEKVVQDLGAAIKDAKDRLGYAKVVLAGWSGGGSLSMFYQQQAQHPTVTASPSGDGPDPHHARAHPGRRHHAAGRAHQSARHADRVAGRVHPRRVRPTRRIPNSTSTTRTTRTSRRTARSSWLATGRRRSTATGGSRPGSRKTGRTAGASRAADDEFGFVVHGTMADPRWLDPPSIPTIAPRAPAIWAILRGEHEPGRPGALLQPAQLAVPVEL